jgi:hypothetical protein
VKWWEFIALLGRSRSRRRLGCGRRRCASDFFKPVTRGRLERADLPDLPKQSARIDLSISLKTTEALGVEMPLQLQQVAENVIE